MCLHRVRAEPVEMSRPILAAELTAGVGALVAWALTGSAIALLGISVTALLLWRQDWLRPVDTSVASDVPAAPDRELVGSR